ncbi:uncharacterized protein LOC110254854 [Exaiptasia diaphana]|uniref:J domain-containing protein n=2 Tax=Exaiptasia diaphana TaxID=2652724 RepID=A0A913YAV4_EXADI|nr:uncharacterized protein LOC110254854 [Exaiptasia diaphana]
MATSASKTERIKGNHFLEKSENEGIGYALKKGRLQDAIRCYNRAQNLAFNHDELASASKNLAKANWKLGQLFRERNEGRVLVFFHLREAIKAFDVSLTRGEDCKSEEWKADIWQSLALCIEGFLDASDEIEDLDERIKTLMPMIDILHVNVFIVRLHLKIGNSYFHDGVNKIHADGDFARCLSRMRDCYYPIQEAKRLSGNSDYEDSEISVLEKDVFYTTCTAESVQARYCGSELLETALKEEENLNMDIVWDVIDWYKRAVILARELDLEQEAIALGRLGHVYNKVLKLRQRSKTYYKKSFELVESMKPRTFFTQPWYQEIVSTLQEFQIEERNYDEKEQQKEREKRLEAIKEEMQNLQKNNTGKIAFLIYVYKSFPPTHPKWEKPTDEEIGSWKGIDSDSDKMEKVEALFKKAITYYHPDRISVEEHGEKWKTLCEEITKLLSAHYETIKLKKQSV